MEKRHIPKNLRCKGSKKSLGAAAAAFAVCLVLLVFLIGAVIGRYQRQLRSDNSVKAKEFYFTSNLLDGGTHTLAPGSTEVTFTLGNYADELRFSEVDIDYKVTVTPADNVTVEYSNTAQKLFTDGKKDDTVTIKGLLPNNTYTVTATGEGGYSKTLTAKIVVLPTEGQVYYNMDNVSGEYILLTVWNEGEEAGNVTIHYKGIPDNTNPNMTDWNTGGETAQEKSVSIEPHESKVFRFFNATDITVEGATAKEPY